MWSLGVFVLSFFTAYADWDLMNSLSDAKCFMHTHRFSAIKHFGFAKKNPNKSKIWRKDAAVYGSKWPDSIRRMSV